MKKIWHNIEKWECCKAGFYNSCSDIGITKDFAKEQYRLFLSNLWYFESVLACVISEWKYSCEHFLSESSRNKIAWLGQASACYAFRLPSEAKGGFKNLSDTQQKEADEMALKYLKIWENAKENNKVFKNVEGKRLRKRYTR